MMPEIQDVTHRLGPGDVETLLRISHPSGLIAFVALHDTRSGPGVGGVRRRRYPDEAAAAADACSLAAQMTLKTRFAGLPCGGAKSVILDAPGMDLPAAYEAFGQAVETLGGRYFCGPDVGTGDTELSWMRRVTAYLNPPGNDASAATARGVLAGIRACLRHRWPDRDPATLITLVQGVGRVGGLVAAGVASREVIVCDPSPEALARVSRARVIEIEDATSTSCDVFAPCAVGPVVTEANVETLPCRIICGSANTQLQSPHLARRLADRGVLYAPDFVVNAGAIIEGVLVQTGELDREAAGARIDAIEDRLLALLTEASATGRTPLEVALS